MIPFREYIIDTQGVLSPEVCVPHLYNIKTGVYGKISFEERNFIDIDGNMEKYKIRPQLSHKDKLAIKDLYVLENTAERILYG